MHTLIYTLFYINDNLHTAMYLNFSPHPPMYLGGFSLLVHKGLPCLLLCFPSYGHTFNSFSTDGILGSFAI